MQSLLELTRIMARPADVGYAINRRVQRLVVPRTWGQVQAFDIPDSVLNQIGKSASSLLQELLSKSKAELSDKRSSPDSFLELAEVKEIQSLTPQLLNYLAKLAWIYGGPRAAESLFFLEANSMLSKHMSWYSSEFSKTRALVHLSSWEEPDGAKQMLQTLKLRRPATRPKCFSVLLDGGGDLEDRSHALFLAPSVMNRENEPYSLTARIWNRQSNHALNPAGDGNVYYLNQGQYPFLKDFLSNLPKSQMAWHNTLFRVRQLPQLTGVPKGVQRSREWDCLMAFSPPLTGVNSILDLVSRGHIVQVEGMDFYTNYVHAPANYLKSGWSSQEDEPPHHKAIRLNSSLATHNLGLNWNLIRLLGLSGKAILTPAGGNDWLSRQKLIESMQAAFSHRLAKG